LVQLEQKRLEQDKVIEKKWKDQLKNPKTFTQEDSESRREHSQETAMRTGLARIRRKRLEQAHKLILMEKIQEKQHRQERLMGNHAQRAASSYAHNI
jgi:hypothetical protein